MLQFTVPSMAMVTLLHLLPIATAATFRGSNTNFQNGYHHIETVSTCEPLRVYDCQILGYNHTLIPNLLGMHDQTYSHHALTSFKPLLQYECSAQLRTVLCGFYAPMCSPITSQPVPPCQALCYSVRRRCEPIMSNFGYPWPSGLNCSSLPIENTPGTMCMEGPEEYTPPPAVAPTFNPAIGGSNVLCPHYPHCPCTIPFSAEDKEFASVWMAIWSVVCCGVTLFTLISFML